jgi:hypothetical protein
MARKPDPQQLAEMIGKLLAEVEAGAMEMGRDTRLRLEGALVALRALDGGPLDRLTELLDQH